MAEKTPTIDEQLLTLEQDVDDFRGRSSPGVRELVVGDYAKEIQKAHGTDRIPEQHLQPTYRKDIESEAAARYEAELRDLDKGIKTQLPTLRAALMARMADERRLRGEAERIDPNLAHEKWLQAMNVDMLGEQRAEAWLDKHADDERAIIDRLQSADPRRDGAFLRLVEARYGLSDDDANDPKDATQRTLVSTPLRRAIRERQDARVTAATRAGLRQVEVFEAAYVQSRAEAFPTDENIGKAFGAIARRAS